MYDFRETTPLTGSDDNQRPAEAMLIDGQYIEDLIPGYSTLQVSGRELLSQSIEKQTIGKSDGEFIQYVRNPSREIVVGYRLAAADNLSFRQAFYKLNDILHGENHQVSFNDDPSKYWIATFSDIDDVPKGRNAITSSFTLFVPDGIAHSVATQTADNMPYKDVPVNLYLNSKTIADTYGSINSPTVTVEPFDSTTNMWHIVAAQGTGSPVGIYLWDYAHGKLLDTTDWSYSADVKGKGKIVQFGIEAGDKNPVVGTIGSEWSRISQTGWFDKPEYKTIAMYFDTNSSPLDVYIKLPKLETGKMPSMWSPNPADPEYYSDTITVHNGGTYPVEPVITATMHADNGLIAFIN
ncbi:phage-related tail component, partial [Lacticaseibacillus paracasei subsp. paracasei Lpp71]